jgi:large subunit ribosomal protein L4e
MLQVFNLDGKPLRKIEAPKVFSIPFRPEVIQRAFHAVMSHSRQRKGTDPLAGTRTSAESHGTGQGIARMARVRGERHPRAGMAAGVASVVKGRRAHAPRSEREVYLHINRRELDLAKASAVAATALRNVVLERGHRVDGVASLPIVVEDEVEDVVKTRDLIRFMRKIGLDKELSRLYGGVKRRSRGASYRGFATRRRRGPLFILNENRGVENAARGIPGVEARLARDLNILDLAPGSHPGRLTIWSESAMKSLSPRIVKLSEVIAA